MSRVSKRDVGPILSKVRELILGRKHTSALRFDSECADRDQPPPSIPDGPAHKLSANYYVNRDPRREVDPPILLNQKLIASGDAKEQLSGSRVAGVPTPGQIYKWDY